MKEKEGLSFPSEDPMFCKKGNCKRIWQTNTLTCTVALFCEKKEHLKTGPAKFCVYVFSCGTVVCTHIEVLPTDTLKVTLGKASAAIMPRLIKQVTNESKTPGCVWH